MKTFRTFASAIATMAALFAFTGCNEEGKNNGTPEKPVVEKKDVVFNVKVKDITVERATITITHNGEKNYTWHGFWYTDVETSVESAIAREVTSLKDNNKSLEGILSNGSINKAFVKNLDSKTTYRYVVFGIDEDGTQYGTPASVDFDTERLDATFSFTVKNQTPESVKIGVVSGSGYPDDTWYAFCIEYKGGDYEDIVEDAVSALGNDIAPALKSGNQNVEFSSLNPGTTYAVGVVGLLENGTVYGEGNVSLVELDDVTFTLAIGEKTESSIPVSITPSYTSETMTWFAFCTPDNGAGISTIIDEQIVRSLGNDIASALRYGKANITFDNLTPADYVIAVVGLRADGTTYGTPVYKKVNLSLVYKQNPNWTVSYTGKDKDGYDNIHVDVSAGADRYAIAVYSADVFESYSIEDIIDDAVAEYISFIDYFYDYFGGQYSKDFIHSICSYTETDDEGFGPLPAGDYVGLAFGIDDQMNITGLYQTGAFTIEASESEAAYAKWIGTWEVTSDSYYTYANQVFTKNDGPAGYGAVEISAKDGSKYYNVTGYPFSDITIPGMLNEDGSFSLLYMKAERAMTHNTYGPCDIYFVPRFYYSGKWYYGTSENDMPVCYVTSEDGVSGTGVGSVTSYTIGDMETVFCDIFASILEGDYAGYTLSFPFNRLVFPTQWTKINTTGASVRSANTGINSAATRKIGLKTAKSGSSLPCTLVAPADAPKCISK